MVEGGIVGVIFEVCLLHPVNRQEQLDVVINVGPKCCSSNTVDHAFGLEVYQLQVFLFIERVSSHHVFIKVDIDRLILVSDSIFGSSILARVFPTWTLYTGSAVIVWEHHSFASRFR